MSRTHGKQIASIRDIFGRKNAQNHATASRGAGHYPLRNRQPSPLKKSKVSKGPNASKRAISTHLGHRNLQIADPSNAISNGTPGSGGELLLHNFVDSINTTHHQIEEEVSKSLAEAETVLEKRLTRTVTKHDGKIERARATRAAIFSPLEPESQGDTGSLGRKDLAHLTDVRNMLNSCEKGLKSHWKAWAKTQQKIACLAVEILGPDSVTLPPVTKEAMGSGAFKRRLASATDAFEKQQSAELKMLESAQKSRNDIARLVREARKQASSQEKKSRDGKRTRREEICQLARKMIANI
ncbi:hypothetical protein AJ78_03387 [Emergomyces pasteurianus Ep9510]|uniref:Uncharacterized protein n=1 Tax=Emergomyces pasteurianus Ep9510 TaxID=1447872 RepID=A0A1J9PK61_9EURO|nr:hypothetical protein AJ78_03387 [Emergomyces pasteurianus Ep9510]